MSEMVPVEEVIEDASQMIEHMAAKISRDGPLSIMPGLRETSPEMPWTGVDGTDLAIFVIDSMVNEALVSTLGEQVKEQAGMLVSIRDYLIEHGAHTDEESMVGQINLVVYGQQPTPETE